MTAVVLAATVDRVLGEPPVALHPVAVFGRAMTALERRVHASSIFRGVIYTGVGIGGAAAVAVLLDRSVGRCASTVIAGSVAMAGRMLESEVAAVGVALADDDLPEARRRISRLVGRSTTGMSEIEIARAAVETMAENSVDAMTATMLWATAFGALGALTHRAANTMDAMVGHRTPRHELFGRASARLDDIVNWVPARLTVLAVVVAQPLRAGRIVTTVRRDARHHPSPNGGVIEAAFAGALGVRLGGVNRYGDRLEDRGELGDGADASASDVERAVSLARRTQAIVLAWCVLAEFGWRLTRSRLRR